MAVYASSNLQQILANQLTQDQVNQLECLANLLAYARAQTPIFKSAMLGFSHPLTDKLQVSADATIVNLTQPVTDFGGSTFGDSSRRERVLPLCTA